MVANILFCRRPPPPPPLPMTLGIKRSQFNFFGTWSVILHIKFMRITIAATGYKIFCLHTTTPTLGMWSMGQNSTFLEHGRVAYQINWNHEI